ncbi:hypothetical protein LNW07_23980 [Klebsiella pneumoniae]|nr:hypothetical protein [Klebsiella pneumoniae]
MPDAYWLNFSSFFDMKDSGKATGEGREVGNEKESDDETGKKKPRKYGALDRTGVRNYLT